MTRNEARVAKVTGEFVKNNTLYMVVDYRVEIPGVIASALTESDALRSRAKYLRRSGNEDQELVLVVKTI